MNESITIALHEFATLTGAGNRSVNEGYNILICPECEEYTWTCVNTSSVIMWLIWDDVVIQELDVVSKEEREVYGADFKVWIDFEHSRKIAVERGLKGKKGNA